MSDEAPSMVETRLTASLEKIEMIFVFVWVVLTLFSPALFSLRMDLTLCIILSNSLHGDPWEDEIFMQYVSNT